MFFFNSFDYDGRGMFLRCVLSPWFHLWWFWPMCVWLRPDTYYRDKFKWWNCDDVCNRWDTFLIHKLDKVILDHNSKSYIFFFHPFWLKLVFCVIKAWHFQSITLLCLVQWSLTRVQYPKYSCIIDLKWIFMKRVVFLKSPSLFRGDIKHITRFINTVWNETSFQFLYITC